MQVMLLLDLLPAVNVPEVEQQSPVALMTYGSPEPVSLVPDSENSSRCLRQSFRGRTTGDRRSPFGPPQLGSRGACRRP